MSTIEVTTTDTRALATVGDRLAAGDIVVLRDWAAIRELMALIVRYAAARDGRPDAIGRLLAFYEGGGQLDLRGTAALAEAIRNARANHVVPRLLAPVIDRLLFGPSVLVHTGVSRLVVSPHLVEQARQSSAFVKTDFERDFADRPTEVFMNRPSNIHRDFNREHSVLQCNIWFPLHDAGPSEVVQIYPDVYRQAVYDVDNTPANRARLPAPIAVTLRCGDAVLFHGEHLHCSPDPTSDGRRHSYDVRVAACAYDDNRHYGDWYYSLNNFVTTRPSDGDPFADSEREVDYAAHFAAHGKTTPAVFYWDDAERRANITTTQARTLADLSSEYPFAEDRAIGLAECIYLADADVAAALLIAVTRQTGSCFWALRAAEALTRMRRESSARDGFARAVDLSDVPARNFAPVSYTTPRTQLTPAEIGLAAGAALAALR